MKYYAAVRSDSNTCMSYKVLGESCKQMSFIAQNPLSTWPLSTARPWAAIKHTHLQTPPAILQGLLHIQKHIQAHWKGHLAAGEEQDMARGRGVAMGTEDNRSEMSETGEEASSIKSGGAWPTQPST